MFYESNYEWFGPSKTVIIIKENVIIHSSFTLLLTHIALKRMSSYNSR